VTRPAFATLALALCVLHAAAQPVAVHRPGPQHGLHFTTPVTTWDEALPLGNGIMGSLIWGDGHPLRISLDRADLWDTRAVPEFQGPDYKFSVMKQWHEQGRVKDLLRVYEEPYGRAAPTKIPAGRIELNFASGTAGFRDTALTLDNAVADMTFTDGSRVEIFVNAQEPVGMAHIMHEASLPDVVLRAPPFRGATAKPADVVRGGDLAQLGYPAPEETSGPRFHAFTQECAEGFRFAVYVAWKDTRESRTLAWSIASGREGADPLAIARARVNAALDRGFLRSLAAHKRWWSNFWAQSSVRVPNAVVERQWFLDTYKWGAAARRGHPPITLQAVWTADNGKLPPWKGDYHHDLNTQLSYWPAYSGNRLEDGLGYLDWLWSTRDTAFEWTRQFFELPGMNVPMTADLRGRQIGGWRQYTHSASTSAWLAQHFYLHWRYSRDRAFLRDRAYPYLHDTAVFLEAFTANKGPDGKRTHPLSASPEINDNRPAAWFNHITNYDLALDRFVFEKAAELAGELNLTDDAARWRAALAEFPDYSRAADGSLLIAPDFPLPASHRHHSHLMAVHPLGLIDWDQGEDARRTIRASLAELESKGTAAWCGYSFSWLANLYARARDGARAERALEIFSTAFTVRNSFHVNGDQSGKGYSRFTYRPFTLEGNFAMPAGLQEMLLQSHSGKVVLFPAIPDTWKDVEFRTLRADGAFLISARRTAGRVSRVEVTAERGGTLKIVSPADGTLKEFTFKPGEQRLLQF
jgi:alpha-L-fucosidase 2